MRITSLKHDWLFGGYQMLKKWLSYRESALFDRPILREVHTELFVHGFLGFPHCF